MPLKFGPISRQLQSMAEAMAKESPTELGYLVQARELLRTIDPQSLRDRLDPASNQRQRVPWLVAVPLGSTSAVFDCQNPPGDFCVIGCDASSVPPDRHNAARFFVLNTGYAALIYGTTPHALLDSSSRLCFELQDLYLFPEKRDVPVDGTILAAKMEVETLDTLRTWMEEQSATGGLPTLQRTHPDASCQFAPMVILRDGPLTLWTLQNETEAVQDSLLSGLLESLRYFQSRNIPVGGYISFTDGRDVANSLRVWLCDGRLNECESCESCHRQLCLALSTLRDRDLYGFLLPGQRSAPFGSSSQILTRYGEQRIDFFYLNVGEEIVRVEIPQWVHQDPALLDLLHATIMDQCRRSAGFPPYPPVLQEAHEQAVITVTDRRVLLELAERAMGQQGQRWVCSAKEDSKRRRGV